MFQDNIDHAENDLKTLLDILSINFPPKLQYQMGSSDWLMIAKDDTRYSASIRKVLHSVQMNCIIICIQYICIYIYIYLLTIMFLKSL